jgi:asparaginyl-tRNA synthetase
MSLLLPVRRSALRPQVFHRRAVVACTHALSLRRSRQSSTFCPTNIAELLRPASPLSPTATQGSPEGEALTVHGYVRSVRKQKRIAFAAIGDGSTLQTVQAVLSPQLAEELVCSLDHRL